MYVCMYVNVTLLKKNSFEKQSVFSNLISFHVHLHFFSCPMLFESCLDHIGGRTFLAKEQFGVTFRHVPQNLKFAIK